MSDIIERRMLGLHADLLEDLSRDELVELLPDGGQCGRDMRAAAARLRATAGAAKHDGKAQ